MGVHGCFMLLSRGRTQLVTLNCIAGSDVTVISATFSSGASTACTESQPFGEVSVARTSAVAMCISALRVASVHTPLPVGYTLYLYGVSYRPGWEYTNIT